LQKAISTIALQKAILFQYLERIAWAVSGFHIPAIIPPLAQKKRGGSFLSGLGEFLGFVFGMGFRHFQEQLVPNLRESNLMFQSQYNNRLFQSDKFGGNRNLKVKAPATTTIPLVPPKQNNI
jgi:hypothetical protein